MKTTKRLFALLLAVLMVAGIMTGCSGKQEAEPTKPATEAPANQETEAKETEAKEAAPASNELVIYSATNELGIETYVTEFEAQTGINVEIISGGTGELLKRIESEAANPLADVEWGGTTSVVLPYAEFFEPYVSANEDELMDACKNVEGCITHVEVLPMCMVVNTELIGDIEINGYEDLLNPALKGKIAMIDPAQSSTGLQHLTAIIQVMGGGDEEKGWEYMRALIENLDGKLISSSSAAGKGVADGEYVVALTHEGYASALIADGYPIKTVYPEEGFFVSSGTVQIVKGCKNLENAKKFVDFMTTKVAQDRAAEMMNYRGSRKDAAVPEGLADLSEMNVAVEDYYNTLENSQRYLDTFKDIYTE